MCAARDHVAHYYAHVTLARVSRVFSGINFGNLLKIRQIKIPAKVSGYTVV